MASGYFCERLSEWSENSIPFGSVLGTMRINGGFFIFSASDGHLRLAEIQAGSIGEDAFLKRSIAADNPRCLPLGTSETGWSKTQLLSD